MISPLMPSAAAIRNSVGAGEVPDLSINPAGQSTAEEERQLKNRAAVKKHYYKKKTIYAEALGRAAKLEEENLHLKEEVLHLHRLLRQHNQLIN